MQRVLRNALDLRMEFLAHLTREEKRGEKKVFRYSIVTIDRYKLTLLKLCHGLIITHLIFFYVVELRSRDSVSLAG